jgi:GDPmannose 4,6-dehydratase
LKRAIIIGITGQDGAYLARLLLAKGYSVIGMTRGVSKQNYKRLEFLGIDKAIEFIEMAQISYDEICRILIKYKPDEIYNLSAQSSVGASFTAPIETVSYNILSVINWLEAIYATKPEAKYYQASSSEMFGNVSQEVLPLKESNVFCPASPYGVSKAAAHWLTVNYRESKRLFATCGILFNHESCLRGDNYIVKKALNTAIKIKMGLSKNPLILGNLSVKRDWGYAPSYVEAMWLMMQQKVAEDFIICSGTSISLHELMQLIFLKLNLSFNEHVKIDPALFRPLELETIYGDNTKSKKELGWSYDLTTEGLIDQLILDETAFIEWEIKK